MVIGPSHTPQETSVQTLLEVSSYASCESRVHEANVSAALSHYA